MWASRGWGRRRLASLLVLVVAAVAAAGSAATAIPSGPRALSAKGTVAAPAAHQAAPSPVAPNPQPWFDLNVASADIGFWQPDALPAGAPAIKAKAGILVDVTNGEILWAQDPHEALPPASLTKVLTALVALENLSPDQEVTITSDALGQSWEDSVMGLKAGEILTVQELLEGMLLPSGDDAASALAVDTVGQARFLAAMNAQEAQLGLHDSHFSNTSGLDDPGLYASAYDLAAITDYTYTHFPLFDQIVGTRTIVLPATADHPEFWLGNLDALLWDYPAAVGVKPGDTGNAGACLIGMAVRGGQTLLAVLLNADYPARLEARLLDWGFAQEGLPPLLPPTPTPSPTPSPPAR